MQIAIIILCIWAAIWIYYAMVVPHYEKKKRKQEFCDCDSAEFTRTVDEDYNPICGRCGRTLKKSRY